MLGTDTTRQFTLIKPGEDGVRERYILRWERGQEAELMGRLDKLIRTGEYSLNPFDLVVIAMSLEKMK